MCVPIDSSQKIAAREPVAKALALAQHLATLLVVDVAGDSHVFFVVKGTLAGVVFLFLAGALVLVLLDKALAPGGVDFFAHLAGASLFVFGLCGFVGGGGGVSGGGNAEGLVLQAFEFLLGCLGPGAAHAGSRASTLARVEFASAHLGGVHAGSEVVLGGGHCHPVVALGLFGLFCELRVGVEGRLWGGSIVVVVVGIVGGAGGRGCRPKVVVAAVRVRIRVGGRRVRGALIEGSRRWGRSKDATALFRVVVAAAVVAGVAGALGEVRRERRSNGHGGGCR
jgi:hypothetical protein